MTADPSTSGFILLGQHHSAQKPAAGLYLIATPIGNLADISLRALQTLSAADVIACEDTRTSKILLNHFGIRTPLISYHEHNEDTLAEKLVTLAETDKVVALVSDAGMPSICDPGFRAVQLARERQITISVLPGASAPMTALVLSGLPPDRFTFAGFLPRKLIALRKALAQDLDRHYGSTMIYFESPKRTIKTLQAMAEVFGPDCKACLARELTKLYETVYTGTLASILNKLDENPTLKGEVVLLAHLPEKTNPVWLPEQLDQLLGDLMIKMPAGKAASEASRITGIERRDLFDRMSELKHAHSDAK